MSAMHGEAVNACENCGHDAGPDVPRPSHCNHCGPYACDQCGGTNDLGRDISCTCWISLEGMPLADLKALFATVDLSIEATP